MRLLVEEGGANPEIADRWGHTPLDEALRVGAGPVIRYFAGMGMAAGAGAAAREPVAPEDGQRPLVGEAGGELFAAPRP